MPDMYDDQPCATPDCGLNRIDGHHLCWRCEEGVSGAQKAPARPPLEQLRFGDVVYGATVTLDETETIDDELIEHLIQPQERSDRNGASSRLIERWP